MKEYFILNQADIDFIQDNLDKNVAKIALDKSCNPKNKTFLIEQIHSRQKAKDKLPEFYASQKLIFPKSLSIEQSSSELTAKYKSTLFSGESFADLTSGFGIDFYYLSQKFHSSDYNEKDERLAEIALYNFKVLGIENIKISGSDYDEFLDENKDLNKQKYDLIFIDPSRRIESVKVKALEDYSPNILLRLDELVNISKKVMIKCSPMLDVNLAIKQLKYVQDVICVSVNLEVRELLFILEKNFTGDIKFRASIFKNTWNEIFFIQKEKNQSVEISDAKKYIYEIDKSIIKLEMQNSFAQKNNLTKLAQDTNYFTSEEKIKNFALSGYEVLEINKYSPKELKKRYSGKYLNIKTRNFPFQSHEIKNKINSIDGDENYLFCFRDFENKLFSVLTKKS
jgi:16S rRNA G966 N2-methylase RsmD